MEVSRDWSRNLEENIHLLHSIQRILQINQVALENRVEELQVDCAEVTEALAMMSDEMNVNILVDTLFERMQCPKLYKLLHLNSFIIPFKSTDF